MDLNKITISQKLIAVCLLLTILPVAIVGFYAYEQTAVGIRSQLEDNLEDQVFIEKDYVDSTFSLAQDKVNSDLGVARSLFYGNGDPAIVDGKMVLGDESITNGHLEIVDGKFSIEGGHVVNYNYEIVDNIQSMVGGTATVFQVIDGEAVRISTNVIKDDGDRAIGTTVSQPVYDAVVNKGETFYGQAWVVNAWYLTAYEPIKDSSGDVIGILYVGVLEDPFINTIRDHMAEIVVGETGYIYVMDSEGNLVLHPNMEGENIYENDFVKDIINTKEGVIHYDWEGRDKIAGFTYYEPNDWIIVSSSYSEEFEGPLMAIRNSIVGAVLIFVILGCIISLLISRSISGGIRKIVDDFDDISNATLQGKLDKRANTDVAIDFEAIPRGFNQVLDAVISPLNVAADYVDRISKGDIPPVITDEYHGDFNTIKNNLNQCIGSINALVADANMLSVAAVEGKLDTRADASRHSGDYRAIVEGVNDTLDAVIGPLNVAAEYVDRIAHGDIPPAITDDYSGDFNEIKNNLNTCIASINALVDDANMLSIAAVDGKLDTRADASRHNGDYRAIVEGVNDTLDAVIGPLNVAAEYVDRIAHGDIPQHITDDYSGDFNEIKDNLNRCIDAIGALVSDANMLSVAAVEGRLDTRADASKHFGDYRAIVEGVNGTLDAVIGPLNVAAEYVDRIAHGDIPQHITDDYSGDFNEIKNNLNQCIDAINTLVSDANMLSVAAVEGKLDTRADASKHHGDYKAIVEGVNDTLDAVIGPLNVAAEYIDRISKGDMPEAITDEYQGDFNLIKNNLNQCVDAVNELISDSEMLAIAATNEEFDTRADVSKHDGKFRDIVDGVNRTLDSVVNKVYWYNSILDNIPFPVSVTDNDLNWTFINRSAEKAIGLKRADILGTQCSQWGASICGTENCGVCRLNAGEPITLFDQPGKDGEDRYFQADNSYIYDAQGEKIGHIEVVQNISASRVNAVYTENEIKRLVGNLENIASGNLDIDSNIADANEYTAVQHGNFSQIYSSLDGVAAAISSLITDADMLAVAAVEGRLDTRADASRHEGDYRKVVEGVNNTLDAVIGPLNVAAEHMDRISKGDIPEKITDSYNGDFNAIKDNLNTCIDAINNLVADADMLAQAGVSGELSTRADASKHQGDYLRIVEGVNNCLDAVVGPVNEASRIITAYSEGDLDARVAIDARGDFKVLGDTLDGFGDTLQGIIGDSCEVLSSISSNDLTREVRVHGVGDFIQLTEGVENCRRSLNDVVSLVMENSEAIASTAQEMSSSTEELTATAEEITSTVAEISDGTQLQSGKAEDVASAMADMGRTVQEVAANSENAAQNAVESNTLIQGLGEMSKDLKVMMDGIRSAVNESSDVINDLDAKSAQIGEIVNLITNIADQTNLLALNAAIEAARAGEHGRGFAVVADEVRKLAEESGDAAQQIADLIAQIQNGTRDAVSSMRKGADEVDAGAISLEKSVLAVDDVVVAGNTIVKMVQEIAAAAEEQSASIEEVTSSVEEVSTISEESAAGAQQASASVQEQTASMQELSRSAQELADVAANMQLVVSKFKLDSVAGGSVVSKDTFDGDVECSFSSETEETDSEFPKNALV
ncbi:Cache 3/Cache 2 fusion domain-containing protein [Methanolobus sp. WCC4]|uniref:Cache 3/Cache 2 fusion domain-containing protein n=1 Tax=Methanolobus sp. WCC4 TaxID=3125784 RepID=UPI0030FADFE1